MEPKDVLHIMRATAPTATIEDAEAFLALCQERGLTPFTEASPIVTDYVNKKGERVHSLSVKEHYTVAERWAQQCGGYTIRERRITRTEKGDIVAHIGIVSNRDYADVGRFCARTGANFKEELAGFIVGGDAMVTADEMKTRRPPTSRTWEWVAEKRAREAAVLQKFGREPTQSRQMYAQAITAQAREVDAHETQALLYGAPALSVAPEPPAPVSPAPVPPEPPEPIEPEFVAPEPELVAPEPAPAPAPAHWAEDEQTRRKFWAWASSQGLSRSDVHAALGVDSISLFKGDKKAAIERITAWIAAQTTPAISVEPSLNPEPASEPEQSAFEPEPAAAASEPQAAPKPAVPATLAEARVEWSKAWNIAKRLGLNPPLLDNKWSIEEIMMNIAILEVEISEATQGASE